jgi:hypothetical protein
LMMKADFFISASHARQSYRACPLSVHVQRNKVAVFKSSSSDTGRAPSACSHSGFEQCRETTQDSRRRGARCGRWSNTRPKPTIPIVLPKSHRPRTGDRPSDAPMHASPGARDGPEIKQARAQARLRTRNLPPGAHHPDARLRCRLHVQLSAQRRAGQQP